MLITSPNTDHPAIKETIPIGGCPPQPNCIAKAVVKIGIDIPDSFLVASPGKVGTSSYVSRYEGEPEFDEAFFRTT